MNQVDSLELAFFAACTLLTLGGALGTVLSPNPIRSALSLLFTLLGVAGFYLQLHAPFLAAVQMLVYVGAVVVLFLFVIMLIGPSADARVAQRALVERVIGGVSVALLAALIVTMLANKRVLTPPVEAGFGSVEAIGQLLFTDYVFPFEASGALLLVAIVGAVAVARGKTPKATASSEAPSDGSKEGVS